MHHLLSGCICARLIPIWTTRRLISRRFSELWCEFGNGFVIVIVGYMMYRYTETQRSLSAHNAPGFSGLYQRPCTFIIAIHANVVSSSQLHQAYTGWRDRHHTNTLSATGLGHAIVPWRDKRRIVHVLFHKYRLHQKIGVRLYILYGLLSPCLPLSSWSGRPRTPCLVSCSTLAEHPYASSSGDGCPEYGDGTTWVK